MDAKIVSTRSDTFPGDTLLLLIVRAACLAALAYWTFFLLRPFLSIILWSIVFTVALYPLYVTFSTLLGGRQKIAAAAITLVSLLIIFGPGTWLALNLADNLRLLIQRLGDGSLTAPAPPIAVKGWPLIGNRIYDIWKLASVSLKDLVEEIAPQLKPVGSRLLVAAGSIGLNIVKFTTAIIISGFLFVPGKSFVLGTKRLLTHVVTSRGEEFMDIAGATVRNVSRGVIGIASLQALLAGVGFLVGGVPAAGLLTFGVLILGIIQIGPSIVILPVIVWYWLTKDTTPALLFTIYMVPVNLIDNVMRPLIMSHGLHTPMPIIFIGLIGGTIGHGLIGLFIGPIVLAIVWQLLVAWTGEENGENSPQAVNAA